MKILYIGNKLSGHGFNKTSIETLGVLFENEGYNMVFTSDKKNILYRFLDMFFTTLRHVNKVDYVVIDVYSTFSFWYALLCSQLIRFFGVKYIAILRGGGLPNRIKTSETLSKMIFRNAYKNVAPSLYLLEEFKQKGYENIVFIPNVLEINKYKFKYRTEFKPKLLWVRSFATIYNPQMAIQVYQKIKLKYPLAELCMVGPDKDGSLIKTKQLAESLGLKVEFTGGMLKEDWINKSAEYDIFINTTHFDNTPISVMEAMALGLGVISTNVGGIPYLLSNNKDSILVNDSDTDGMVEAISRLILNIDEAQFLTANARKKVEQFDWEVVKKQWKELLT